MENIGCIGECVNIAIQRFTSIGEQIADKNADIRQEMYEACNEARTAGTSLEQLCSVIVTDAWKLNSVNFNNRHAMNNVNKSLIGSITRVLLLADIVVVKQLLLSKDKISQSIDKLESVFNFTEFVKAFSVFGGAMVELANFTSSQPNKLNKERSQAQISIARKVIEQTTTIMLTSSKVCLMLTECAMAKESRDTVFCQIRRTMDLIHFVLKDGVIENNNSIAIQSEAPLHLWQSYNESLYFALIKFSHLMNNYKQANTKIKKKTSKSIHCQNLHQTNSLSEAWCNIKRHKTDKVFTLNPVSKELLIIAMDNILERTEDFTDSAYTNQETREKIILLRERCKLELKLYLKRSAYLDQKKNLKYLYKIEETSENVLIAISDLLEQLVSSVDDQVFDLIHSLNMTIEMLVNCRSYAINQELDHLHGSIRYFHNYCEHVLDVCKLIQHTASNEKHLFEIQFLESNVRLYGPQVINAAHILSYYPSIEIAHENFEAFLAMWRWLSSEIITIYGELIEFTQSQKLPNYVEDYSLLSLQRYQENKARSEEDGTQENDNIEVNKTSLSESIEEETDHWINESYENNDIVKRTRNMSSMAFLMFQFTNGNGALRTTQDLFTQAEYFAEEANRLYKVVRQFSYQVPAGDHKKQLLNLLDKIPTYVQALQFTVKDHTVGKAATFVKVDQVIRETKNLMNSINKVTTACFNCANQYKLNFNELAGRTLCGYQREEESGAVAIGEPKGTANITEGSM